MNDHIKILDRCRVAARDWHDDQLPVSEMLRFSETYQTHNLGRFQTELLDALTCVYGALADPEEVSHYRPGELEEDANALWYLVETVWIAMNP